VAVLSIRGPITHHSEGGLLAALFGETTYDSIGAEFRTAMADEAVRAIVLDIDSPGGTVAGAPELAAEIYRARGRKPVVALANAHAMSAAYWLGSSAEEFYITPSGEGGSIGVIASHMNLSGAAEKAGIQPTILSAGKYKAEVNEFEPLNDEALAAAQHRIEAAYDLFVHDVARNRGATEAQVRNGYGEGRYLVAKDAVKAGLFDGERTFEQVLRNIGQSRSSSPAAALEETERAAESIPFGVHATQALAAMQAFISRAQALAALRAEEGRPLGESARNALFSFAEAVAEQTQLVDQLIRNQPDARARQDAEAFARFRVALLRDEAAATQQALEMNAR